MYFFSINSKAQASFSILFAMAVFLVFFSQLNAQAVDNGSVTGFPPANSGIQSGNAPFWTRCSFSPDLCDVGFPSYSGNSSVAVSASPDGGTWLGIAALGECAQTTISGLTIGDSYTLYFCGANFGSNGFYNGVNALVNVSVGATSTAINIPMVASTWNPFSMNFTASSASMVLRVDNPSGSAAYASLDGFNLTGGLCNPVPLPIEGLNFWGEMQDCGVNLNWEVADNQEFESFELQRSDDGLDFRTMTVVDTGTENEFFRRDDYPFLNGFYRLRVRGMNGNVQETVAISIEKICDGGGLEIVPNPVLAQHHTEIRLWLKSDVTDLEVLDVHGRLVYQTRILAPAEQWHRLDLDVSGMPAGIYFIRSSGGELAKLVVQ